jgi:membrane-bound serine protease (ClpP class)
MGDGRWAMSARSREAGREARRHPYHASVRRLLFAAATAVLALAASPARSDDGFRVDVVVVQGSLDARLVSFAVGAIERSTADLVVLQVDVGAVLHESVVDLIALVADPPLPLAVWVGPAPGVARGGAAALVSAAPLRGAAPGTRMGAASPPVAGGADDPGGVRSLAPELPSELVHGVIEVGDSAIPGMVDVVQPAIGQFVAALHGLEVTVRGHTIELDTARIDVVDGMERVLPAGPVRFVEPGLVDRVLRSTLVPEVAFSFLVLGLAFIVLEFYAAGPGLAAVTGALLLLLSGHGIASLPVWWPAVGATLLGVLLYVVEFQRNALGWMSALGSALLLFGGIRFVVPSEQVAATWWVIVLVVAVLAGFFLFGVSTVARTRFATQTIGRQHLVGRDGIAEGPIAPEGYVSVAGARWRARAARAAGIAAGDSVRVIAVDGIVLEVAPDEGSEGR